MRERERGAFFGRNDFVNIDLINIIGFNNSLLGQKDRSTDIITRFNSQISFIVLKKQT